jgi:hypothetical protein
MTELIHYQPGKAFYDSYQGARGNTLAKLAITGEGEQRKSALADLYGLDPSLASQAQAQIGKNDEQDYSELVQSARVMYSLKGRPEADMMWQRVAPKFSQKYGIQFNPTPQPSDWDAIEQIVRATDGGKPKARSSHILADGTIAFMDEFGNLTRTSEKASNSYGFQTDAEGNVYAQDKRGGTVAPAPMGSVQQGMPQVQAGADPMSNGLDRINETAQILKQNGVPVDQINKWVDAEFAKLQGSVQGGVVEQAPTQATTGQAKVAVKPKEEKIETWGSPTAVTKNGKPAMIQISNLGNERERPDLAPADSTKAPTVDASNAAGFYKRMAQSEQIISKIEQEGYSPASNKGDFFTAGGTFSNWATSPKGQQYYNAATNWIRANLRKESGAAIGVDEAKLEYSTYFPSPGDTKETIEQKRQLRQQTAESVKGAGLPAMKYQDQSGSGSQANGFDPLGILK